MKWLALSLLAVVLGLQYRLWLSGDGVREVARLSEAVERQKAENEELVARNEQMVAEVSDLGVQLKDHSRGLIDFPSMRDGRVVLLCWQLGERDEIEFWHETEAGFAGRQPL